METGRVLWDHLSRNAGPSSSFQLHIATAGIQYSDSASFLRRQLREGAESLLPSLTLGGDSLGTEERITYLSCSWCFPSNLNASHSNLFIAVQRDAGPPRPCSLRGPTGRDRFLKGPADCMPRTVQTFSRTSPPSPGTMARPVLPTPGCFTRIVPIAQDYTTPEDTPPPDCGRAPVLSSPHLQGWGGRKKVQSLQFSFLPLIRFGANTFIHSLNKSGDEKKSPSPSW